MALINHLSWDHRTAYTMMNFDLTGSTPRFISEFHVDQLLEILRQIRTDAGIYEQLSEMD